MSHALRFDDERSRAIEEVYGTADVVAQRRAVLAALAPRPGERVLDLGCGPGFLAADLAAAVGPGGRVHGVDASPSMLALARGREAAASAAPLELSEGDVEALAFPDASFDAAACTQVYEYVDGIEGALAEARRVLAPGGRLAVLDTDWDSIVWRSDDDGRMARVLRDWDAHAVHRDLPRRLPALLGAAGLTLRRSEVVPLLNVGYDRDTFSGGLVELIASFVAGGAGEAAGEAAPWAAGLRAMGPDYFFSLNRYLFVATR